MKKDSKAKEDNFSFVIYPHPSLKEPLKILLRMRSYIYLILLIVPLTLQTTCTTSSDKEESKIWEAIPELVGITVKDMKIINDELFVAGIQGNQGVVYKSKDGNNWELAIPFNNYFILGVKAITLWGDDIAALAPGLPISIITADTIYPISPNILIDVSEAISFENGILIGADREYDFIYFKNDSLIRVQDYLYTYYDCVKQSGITSIAVSKFILSEDLSTEKVLIGNYSSNHFVTSFYNNNIECFPHTNLSQVDKFHGVNDLLYINGKLFSAGFARLVYYEENIGWQQFRDTLPQISGGFPDALSITYDPKRDKIYASTNFIGVISGATAQGWVPFNSGISALSGEFYDSIPELIYFRDRLFLGYGDSKRWKSVSTGVLKYNLN